MLCCQKVDLVRDGTSILRAGAGLEAWLGGNGKGQLQHLKKSLQVQR